MSEAEDAKKRVARTIDESREQITAFLSQLIRFDTTMGPDVGLEEEAQQWIGRQLEDIGFKVDIWNVSKDIFGKEIKRPRPDCVGVLESDGRNHSSGVGSLVMNSHVDTVPPGDLSKWTYDPFGGQILQNKIIGRGACDAKGGLTALIQAAKFILRSGYDLNNKLIIESVMGEESGEGGTLSTIERGYKADAAIVAEPTDLQIQPLEGGVLWLKVTVPGLSGHTAFRWSGVHAGGNADSVNAIEKGVKIIDALLDLERHWALRKVHPLFPRGWTTISPNVINGGTVPNTIPGSMDVIFNIWYHPTESSKDVRREVEEVIHATSVSDWWLRTHVPKLDWFLDFEPASTDVEDPIVNTMAINLRTVMGSKERSVVDAFQAVCDMKFLRNEGGMPCVIFGPGSLKDAHAADESLTIDSLVAATKTLAFTIIDWCGVTRRNS